MELSRQMLLLAAENYGSYYLHITYLLILYYHAQYVNILTFEIHEKISARKYAILANFATL